MTITRSQKDETSLQIVRDEDQPHAAVRRPAGRGCATCRAARLRRAPRSASSAISSSGPAISIIAIMARWPMPPEHLVRIAGRRRVARRGSARPRAWPAPARAPRAWPTFSCVRSVSTICRTWTVVDRVQRIFRILQDHRNSACPPARAADGPRAIVEQVDAVEVQPLRRAPRQGAGVRPHDGAAGLRLARAGSRRRCRAARGRA